MLGEVRGNTWQGCRTAEQWMLTAVERDKQCWWLCGASRQGLGGAQIGVAVKALPERPGAARREGREDWSSWQDQCRSGSSWGSRGLGLSALTGFALCLQPLPC